MIFVNLLGALYETLWLLYAALWVKIGEDFEALKWVWIQELLKDAYAQVFESSHLIGCWSVPIVII